MSIRSFWIISLAKDEKIIYSRRFPSVEQRAKRMRSSYVPLPSDEDFASHLLKRLELSGNSAPEFDAWRDDCNLASRIPVLEVKTENGVLWPLLVIEQYGLFFCCLGLEKEWNSSIPLYEVPSVTSGFSILLTIIGYLGKSVIQLPENIAKIAELDYFLLLSLPFGRMISAPPIVDSTLQQWDQATKRTPVKSKTKSKSVIITEVVEYVRCIQHAKILESTLELTGTVNFSMDSEDTDSSLVLQFLPPATTSSLNVVAFHPAVKIGKGEEGYTLQVQHQGQAFSLCHYSVNYLDLPPIIGAYILKDKDSHSSELFIKLNLSRGAKNSFDFLEVHIPFYNRGRITTFDPISSHGTPLISEDRTSITWNIGGFPKHLEVTLKADLKFNSQEQGLKPPDAFCNAQNTFAQVHCKSTGFTLSGSQVTVEKPPFKMRVIANERVLYTDYKIWNDNGDIPTNIS